MNIWSPVLFYQKSCDSEPCQKISWGLTGSNLVFELISGLKKDLEPGPCAGQPQTRSVELEAMIAHSFLISCACTASKVCHHMWRLQRERRAQIFWQCFTFWASPCNKEKTESQACSEWPPLSLACLWVWIYAASVAKLCFWVPFYRSPGSVQCVSLHFAVSHFQEEFMSPWWKVMNY